MRLLSFKGGLHPDDKKSMSKDFPIKDYTPKGDVAIPLSQHIGAPANPIVNIGDHVLKGQLIAEAGGFVSAPIHSSVSGVVKSIEPRRIGNGSQVSTIVIENDHLFETVPFDKVTDISSLSREQILERIKNAGVVGMGGAGFPTIVKLSPKEPDNIEYVIANCAECEPYLTSDYRLMVEYPEKLIEGMKIIVSLFKNAKGLIAIEDNKMDCIEKISEMVKDEPSIEVRACKTKYPQGSERHLIYAITKRQINSKMLPADAGCIVDNCGTIQAIYDAVRFGKPLIENIVTITGDAISEPRNYLAPIGTNFTELVEAAGGFKSEPEKIISGGPMMGFAVFDTDFPVTKTTTALTCMSHDEVAEAEETACINCGRCVLVCPSRLVPTMLVKKLQNNDIEGFEKLHGDECVECGCCAFICPAKRQLTQIIRAGRQSVIAARRKK